MYIPIGPIGKRILELTAAFEATNSDLIIQLRVNQMKRRDPADLFIVLKRKKHNEETSGFAFMFPAITSEIRKSILHYNAKKLMRVKS